MYMNIKTALTRRALSRFVITEIQTNGEYKLQFLTAKSRSGRLVFYSYYYHFSFSFQLKKKRCIQNRNVSSARSMQSFVLLYYTGSSYYYFRLVFIYKNIK